MQCLLTTQASLQTSDVKSSTEYSFRIQLRMFNFGICKRLDFTWKRFL